MNLTPEQRKEIHKAKEGAQETGVIEWHQMKKRRREKMERQMKKQTKTKFKKTTPMCCIPE